MKEDKLQAEIVLWFGQQYPDQKWKLIAINNNSFNAGQAIYNRSMGLSKSAPDLIFLNHGKVLGLELKAPGKRHSTEHIRQQIEFGKKMTINQFYYFMLADIALIKEIITDFMLLNYNYIDKMQDFAMQVVENKLLKKNKTIKF